MSRPTRSSSEALTRAVQEFLDARAEPPAPPPALPPNAMAPPRPRPSGTGLRAAYESVLAHDAAQQAAPAPARATPWQRAWRPLLFLAVSGAAAYVWVGHPPWLAPPAPVALTAPVTELSGRRQLLAIALEIEDYRRTTGRLPGALNDLGLGAGHVRYLRLPGERYELRVGSGPHTVSYRSAPDGVAEVSRAGEP